MSSGDRLPRRHPLRARGLMAAKAMKAGMEILRPLLAETGAPQIGTVVIGTVKGDIHDIGKNLVAMMMEGAGFQVINLGMNNDAGKFIDAIQSQLRHPGDERPAHDDDALHAGRDPGAQRRRAARQGHRDGRRGAVTQALRTDRRRRLWARRGDHRRDRQEARCRPAWYGAWPDDAGFAARANGRRNHARRRECCRG